MPIQIDSHTGTVLGEPELHFRFPAGRRSRDFFLPIGITLHDVECFEHRIEMQMKLIVHLLTHTLRVYGAFP